jgi:hypothetical protein
LSVDVWGSLGKTQGLPKKIKEEKKTCTKIYSSVCALLLHMDAILVKIVSSKKLSNKK